MHRSVHFRAVILAVAASVAMIGTDPALADKPSWAGGGKADKHERKDKHTGGDGQQGQGKEHGARDERSDRAAPSVHFEDRHRVVIHDYYAREFKAGRCPPGLAKKHNGCMPPGQAKQWSLGHPLPRQVIFYELPPAIAVELGVPPPGYRYVRVANDILLVAIGTGTVVDAIQDLGRF